MKEFWNTIQLVFAAVGGWYLPLSEAGLAISLAAVTDS